MRANLLLCVTANFPFNPQPPRYYDRFVDFDFIAFMDQFLTQIYTVIHKIPYGKVTTYGEVARLAGYPGYARHVGKALGNLPEGSKLPWHRVINSKGEISLKGEDFERQKNRLTSEGIGVNANGKISLRLYRWEF